MLQPDLLCLGTVNFSMDLTAAMKSASRRVRKFVSVAMTATARIGAGSKFRAEHEAG